MVASTRSIAYRRHPPPPLCVVVRDGYQSQTVWHDKGGTRPPLLLLRFSAGQPSRRGLGVEAHSKETLVALFRKQKEKDGCTGGSVPRLEANNTDASMKNLFTHSLLFLLLMLMIAVISSPSVFNCWILLIRDTVCTCAAQRHRLSVAYVAWIETEVKVKDNGFLVSVLLSAGGHSDIASLSLSPSPSLSLAWASRRLVRIFPSPLSSIASPPPNRLCVLHVLCFVLPVGVGALFVHTLNRSLDTILPVDFPYAVVRIIIIIIIIIIIPLNCVLLGQDLRSSLNTVSTIKDCVHQGPQEFSHGWSRTTHLIRSSLERRKKGGSSRSATSPGSSLTTPIEQASKPTHPQPPSTASLSPSSAGSATAVPQKRQAHGNVNKATALPAPPVVVLEADLFPKPMTFAKGTNTTAKRLEVGVQSLSGTSNTLTWVNPTDGPDGVVQGFDPTTAIAAQMVHSPPAVRGSIGEAPAYAGGTAGAAAAAAGAAPQNQHSILVEASSGAVVTVCEPAASTKAGSGKTPDAHDERSAGSISPHIFCPLQNLGNSCYFNSCVQLLANCPGFVYGMRNSPFARSRDIAAAGRRRQARGESSSQQFYESMARLLFAMEFHPPPHGAALSTEEALNSLGIVNPTFEGRSQQDCAEMMCTVLGTVEEEGKLVAKMQAPRIAMEDSRMLGDDLDLEEDPLTPGEANFSTTSASPDPAPAKSGRSMPYSPTISSADGQRKPICGSVHWSKLLLLMQQINDENAKLHMAEQRRSNERNIKAGKANKVVNTAFVPPKLMFHDATNPFTGYTVTETRCHSCDGTSRSVHTFQTLLLDIPTTEERVKTSSYKVYGAGRQHRRDSPQMLASGARQQSPPRPRSTPALRAFEARAADRSAERESLSASQTDVPHSPGISSRSGGSAFTSTAKKRTMTGSFMGFFSSIKDKLFAKHINEMRTLLECLYHHFLPVHFKGQSNLYKCESCGRSAEATTTEYLAHLPETLLVQMKRFESGTLFQSKKEDPVEFPVSWQPIREKQPFSALDEDNVLDLSPFIHPFLRPTYRSTHDEARDLEAARHAERQHRRTYSYTSSNNNDGSMNPTSSYAVPLHPVSTYSLVGIVNHHGSLGGGHYTTYARKVTKEGKSVWVLLNDEEVSGAHEEDVANSEEYILMYRQQPVVRRPGSTETRLRELAKFLLQTMGKRPAAIPSATQGQAVAVVGSPGPRPRRGSTSFTSTFGGGGKVFIARSWLHSAAFLDDPGPIMNRVCYCSAAEQERPVPVPSLPNLSRDAPDVPHVHLVPLEWYYVAVNQDDYEMFYRHYGGNAWEMVSAPSFRLPPSRFLLFFALRRSHAGTSIYLFESSAPMNHRRKNMCTSFLLVMLFCFAIHSSRMDRSPPREMESDGTEVCEQAECQMSSKHNGSPSESEPTRPSPSEVKWEVHRCPFSAQHMAVPLSASVCVVHRRPLSRFYYQPHPLQCAHSPAPLPGRRFIFSLSLDAEAMEQDSFLLDLTPFRPRQRTPAEGAEEGSPPQTPAEGGTGSIFSPSLLPLTQPSNAGTQLPAPAQGGPQPADDAELHYIWGTNISEEIFRQDFRRYLETFEAPHALASPSGSPAVSHDATAATLESEHSLGGLVSRTMSDTGAVLAAPKRLYYMQEMLKLYVEGRTSLELEMTWLQQFAPDIFVNTVNQPTECCQMMSAVVEEVMRELIASRYRLPVPEEVVLSVAPKHMPSTIALKELGPHHIEKLISLKGMVIRVSKIIPEVRVAAFECWNCRYVERSACGDRGRIFEPTRCVQCGKSYTFKLQHNLSIFEDKQLVKVQESPENVSDGETPISISVVVYGQMVDAVIPGDRVVATGIYRSTPIRLNANTKIIKSVFATHMDALHLELVRSSRHVDSGGNNSSARQPAATINPAGASTATLHAGGPASTLEALPSMAGSSREGLQRSNATVDPARLDMFHRIARRTDIYDVLLRSFARTIWGHEDVKRGILAQLFGGTPKKFVFTRSASGGGGDPQHLAPQGASPPPASTQLRAAASGPSVTGDASNSASFRSELNVLLCGDPGVAKSQLLTQVHEVAPRGVYTSGKGSSSVGLTAFVVKDSDTGELVLEPGALVLSDQGLCCIDEFDKMNDSTRSVLLEVMEQQTLSIAKAGIIAQLNARTSILAAANPKESQWNPTLNVVENLQIESTLLSRFDLIFLLLDRHDPAEDRRLAAHVLDLYMEAPTSSDPSAAAGPAQSAAAAAAAQQPVVLELDGRVFLQGRDGDFHMPLPILSEYIAVAREAVLPQLTKESHQQLAASFVELRRARGSTRVVSATLRQLESMIRLAEARAKMRFSTTVSVEDVREAKRLMSAALKEAATDPKTGLISLDMFHAPDLNKNSVEGNLQRLEALVRRQYVAAGKTSATVMELRHSFNEGMVGGLRPLNAGQFLELLSLAAGGDAIESFTATNVVFADRGGGAAEGKPTLKKYSILLLFVCLFLRLP
eukprot:gene631-349_t